MSIQNISHSTQPANFFLKISLGGATIFFAIAILSAFEILPFATPLLYASTALFAISIIGILVNHKRKTLPIPSLPAPSLPDPSTSSTVPAISSVSSSSTVTTISFDSATFRPACHRLMIQAFGNDVTDITGGLYALNADFIHKISNDSCSKLRNLPQIGVGTQGLLALEDCIKKAAQIIEEGRKNNTNRKIYIYYVTDGEWASLKTIAEANKATAKFITLLGEGLRFVKFIGIAIAKTNDPFKHLINNLCGRFFQVADASKIPSIIESIVQEDENQMQVLTETRATLHVEGEAQLSHANDKITKPQINVVFPSTPNNGYSTVLVDLTIPIDASPPSHIDVNFQSTNLIDASAINTDVRIPLNTSIFSKTSPLIMETLESDDLYQKLYSKYIPEWVDQVNLFHAGQSNETTLYESSQQLLERIIDCRKKQSINNLPLCSALLRVEDALKSLMNVNFAPTSENFKEHFNQITSKIDFHDGHTLPSEMQAINLIKNSIAERFYWANFSPDEAEAYLYHKVENARLKEPNIESLSKILLHRMPKDAMNIVLDFMGAPKMIFRPSTQEGPCFGLTFIEGFDQDPASTPTDLIWKIRGAHHLINVLPSGKIVVTPDNHSKDLYFDDLDAYVAYLEHKTNDVTKPELFDQSLHDAKKVKLIESDSLQNIRPARANHSFSRYRRRPTNTGSHSSVTIPPTFPPNGGTQPPPAARHRFRRRGSPSVSTPPAFSTSSSSTVDIRPKFPMEEIPKAPLATPIHVTCNASDGYLVSSSKDSRTFRICIKLHAHCPTRELRKVGTDHMFSVDVSGSMLEETTEGRNRIQDATDALIATIPGILKN